MFDKGDVGGPVNEVQGGSDRRRTRPGGGAQGDGPELHDELEGLTDLERELAQLRGELAEAQDRMQQAERERELEKLLLGAGVVDLDTAMTMAKSLMADDEETNAATVVSQLRVSKAFLFSAGGGFATSGAVRDDEGAGLGAMAKRARRGGDRRSLFEYLRARRGA